MLAPSRICDVHAPRPAVGRCTRDRDVAAEIDDSPGERRPGGLHRGERARCGEALADPTEVNGGAPLDASPARGRIDVDVGACMPPFDDYGRSVG